MKRRTILFILETGTNWIGGIYYYKNLIYQLSLLNTKDAAKYQIVLLANIEVREHIESLSEYAKVYYYSNDNKLAKYSLWYFWMWRVDYIFRYDNIASVDLLKIFSQKAIEWIPDFQHNYFPEFFSEEELQIRNTDFERIAETGRFVVLSSETCRDDFYKFYNVGSNTKVGVVHFVSAIEKEVSAICEQSIREIKNKYNLRKKYVFVANQFWKHKNHIVVFKAISEAVKADVLSDFEFVFSGNLQDYRNPEYYEELCTTIQQGNIKEKIKILGFIPREDQLNLMAGAEFIIQPSLFEGWGTVVEDAKVLDKTILLSDIPVHREQMSNKCMLFNPYDPIELLRVMQIIGTTEKTDIIENGISDMKARAKEYAKAFDELIKE